MEEPVAHVYALCQPNGTRCYVGSTLGTLAQRLVRHKWRAASGERPTSRVHTMMRDIGPGQFTINLIETVPLANRIKTEAKHIREYGVWNMVIPGRSDAERRADARAARAAQVALLAQPAAE